MNNPARTGREGEAAAAAYMKRNGWKIAAVNYTVRGGELDIVAENAQYIVFCEVKTRSPHTLVPAVYSVDARKQARLALAAQLYLSENPTDKQPRFDYIEIKADGGKYTVVSHIENAFGG